MTITILWWHIPAILTAIWLTFCIWSGTRRGNAIEGMADLIFILAGLAVVLLSWVGFMGWRMLA